MMGVRQATQLPEISTPAFVGRERELAALGQALLRPPAMVLVEGEPGSGKSRLVREFLAAVPTRDQHILLAVCPPFREGLTLGPIVDAIRRAHDDLAGLALSDLAGTLRPLFPEWTQRLPPPPPPLADAKASRHRLFRALTELLAAAGTTGLVVEDAHWADAVTLEFLVYLAAHPPARTGRVRPRPTGPAPPAPPSLVVTYCPEEVPAASLLLRLSSRVPAGTSRVRIGLAPLDLPATARMAASMLPGAPVSTRFATFLHERTDGVPLAVEETVRLLGDRAELTRPDGEWTCRGTGELRLSPTIRDSVRERVRRLDDPVQQVLRAAAVLGEPVEPVIVAQVAGLASAEVESALAGATCSGLLREDASGRFGFRHVFLGQAVYEAILSGDRRRLHRRAGDVLESMYPRPVAQLARHFREGHEVTRWSRYAEQAAARASASGDRTTATVLLQELLAAASSGAGAGAETGAETGAGTGAGARTGVGTGAGAGTEGPSAGDVAATQLTPHTLGRLAGQLAAAALARGADADDLHEQVVRTLRMVLDTSRIGARNDGEIRSLLGRLLARQGDLAAARTELERAVPNLAHDPAQAARTMTYLGWPLFGPWPARVHLRWLDRAAALEPQIASPAETLAVRADRATALLQLGEVDGWDLAAELPQELPAGEPDVAFQDQWARAQLNIGTAAIVWGRYQAARDWLEAGLAVADAQRQRRVHAWLVAALAELDWLTGGWQGLESRITSLLDTEVMDPVNRLTLAAPIGWLCAAAGDLRRAEAHFELGLREAEQRGVFQRALAPAAALARLQLADGHVEAAVRVTEESIRTVTATRIWVHATEIAPARAESLIAAGRAGEAVELVTAYARGLRGCRAAAARAGLATCRAVLAECHRPAGDAVAPYARAAAAWDRLPRPYDALLARERQAGCLLAAGSPEPALALLRRTWQGLADLGAGGDADRVAGMLRQHGVDVRRPWRGGRHGYGRQLSPRELEVVRLVLAGRTNREIALALHKSPRTVAGQLGSAMRKLGVSSRTELAVRLVETKAVLHP